MNTAPGVEGTETHSNSSFSKEQMAPFKPENETCALRPAAGPRRGVDQKDSRRHSTPHLRNPLTALGGQGGGDKRQCFLQTTQKAKCKSVGWNKILKSR